MGLLRDSSGAPGDWGQSYMSIQFYTKVICSYRRVAGVMLPCRTGTLKRSAAMPRTLSKNHAHFQRAVQRMPLGVASNFRFWGEDRTIYVKSGRGARITDLDDNVYVDYHMGYGPAILGYADARVDAAAREGMEVGGVFALSTEREYKVAERIAQMVPAAELVRFSNSGTEAVMAALRLARAYTKKDNYVILE